MSSAKAIISYKGLQLAVEGGQSILVPYSEDLKEGDTVEIKEALFVQTEKGALIGTPTVPAHVRLQVEGTVRDPKIIVFKHSRKHKHHRVRGHRQKHLKVRVLSVEA